LNSKIEESKTDTNTEILKEFIVNIPSNAKKEDLLDLKNFLLTEDN